MNGVVLLGMGPTALTALESLAERFRVLAVVRPAAHGGAEAEPGGDPVAARAARLSVPVVADHAPAAVAALVHRLDPDCVVVSSYDRILPADLVATRPFVNVHYAPLPRYRGRATVNWAILNGEPDAAISVHRLAPDLDAGNILFQERVPIRPHDTVGELYRRLNGIQFARLGEIVEQVLAGYRGVPQEGSAASYACSRVPEDGQIDWAAPTGAVYALVRALGPPYPGAFTHLGGRRLTVWSAVPVEDAPRYEGRVPGRVVARSTKDGHVDVLTGDGVLRLLLVQCDGADRAVRPARVVTSVRATLGLRTADLLARVEELQARLDQVHAVLAAQAVAGKAGQPVVANERGRP